MRLFPQNSRSAAAGFSLIELLVVIFIVTIIATVVLVRHASFNSTTLLNNLAYDIALTIRQAQAYGVSVRSTSADTFQSAYGVHFTHADRTSFVLYQDLRGDDVSDPPNNFYDGPDELVEQFTLGRGYTVKDACSFILGAASNTCFSGGLPYLDVAFKRPNPDAIVNGVTSQNACVVVTDAREEATRTITILTTGQISISSDTGTCP